MVSDTEDSRALPEHSRLRQDHPDPASLPPSLSRVTPGAAQAASLLQCARQRVRARPINSRSRDGYAENLRDHWSLALKCSFTTKKAPKTNLT